MSQDGWIAQQVKRYEDMSPGGLLTLYQERDGDIIIQVMMDKDQGSRIAFVQFCMPFSGGGQSPRTHAALVKC